MKQSKISKDLLMLSILTLIAVSTWIILDTYRIIKGNALPTIVQNQLEPINPKIDQQILENLSQKTKINRETLPALGVNPTPGE